jgi:hypothetical protein
VEWFGLLGRRAAGRADAGRASMVVSKSLDREVSALAPFRYQKFCQNFQIPRHIEIFERMYEALNIDKK